MGTLLRNVASVIAVIAVPLGFLAAPTPAQAASCESVIAALQGLYTQDPKPPADHWAFDAIAELAAKGVIDNNPEAFGNRAMTRGPFVPMPPRWREEVVDYGPGKAKFHYTYHSGKLWRWAIDRNGDGSYETVLYDLNYDGKWDEVLILGADGRYKTYTLVCKTGSQDTDSLDRDGRAHGGSGGDKDRR